MIKLCSDILLQITQTFAAFTQRAAPTSAPLHANPGGARSPDAFMHFESKNRFSYYKDVLSS